MFKECSTLTAVCEQLRVSLKENFVQCTQFISQRKPQLFTSCLTHFISFLESPTNQSCPQVTADTSLCDISMADLCHTESSPINVEFLLLNANTKCRLSVSGESIPFLDQFLTCENVYPSNLLQEGAKKIGQL